MKDGITNMHGFPRDSNTIITITIFTYSQCAHLSYILLEQNLNMTIHYESEPKPQMLVCLQ